MPAQLIAILAHQPVEGLAQAVREARAANAHAWITAAVAIGLAQERSRRGDRAIERLSAMLGLHRSRVARLGQIFRELLRPLVDLGHDPALRERSWYDTALELAGRRRHEPVPVYLEAERRRLADPSWTCRAWRREAGLEQSQVGTNDVADAIHVLLDAQLEQVTEAIPIERALTSARRASLYAARLVERIIGAYTPATEVGVCLTSPDLRCFGMSPAGRRMFDGSPDERPEVAVIDDRIWLAVRADGTRLRTAEFPAAVALRTGREAHERYHTVTFAMRPIWIDVTSRPVADLVLTEVREVPR